MTTDLATTGPTPLDAILADPEKLKDLPVETMERLFALQREARSDQAKAEFFTAFHSLQSELEPIKAHGWNKHTKSHYARLDDVDRMLGPLTLKHGFTVSVSSAINDKVDHYTFILIVRHGGGYEERHPLELPADYIGSGGSMTKTKIHGALSAESYAERRLKTMVFNLTVLVARDDDGNAAGGVGPSAERITQAQADELNQLADEVGADKILFCTYLKVDSFTSIPAGRFREAKQALERKATK